MKKLLLFILAVTPLVGCATSEIGEKSEGELIRLHREKITELRKEDKVILAEINYLLDQSEAYLDKAEKTDDEEDKKLLVATAQAVLVEANTRRLYEARRASYELALRAYNERSKRVISIRDRIETYLPKK